MRLLLPTDFVFPNNDAVKLINDFFGESHEIALLHVISDEGFSNPPMTEEDYNKEIAYKRTQLEELSKMFKSKTKVIVRKGAITNSVVNFFEESGSDILILGHQKLGFFDRFLNRDIRKEVLNIVRCPVMCF
ncbi:MAG: universal stress protein [Halobacteriovoraceae bacterium]|nr:universal stress protein [Halobacteriovoraceae bacterium]